MQEVKLCVGTDSKHTASNCKKRNRKEHERIPTRQ